MAQGQGKGVPISPHVYQHIVDDDGNDEDYTYSSRCEVLSYCGFEQ